MQEVCPSCGNFVDSLDAATGWCNNCTIPSHLICKRCKEAYPEQNQGASGSRTYCASCKEEIFLEQNADALEAYLVDGYTLTQARERVIIDKRPFCVTCGNVIKGGRKGKSRFCSSCTRPKRRYRTLAERFIREGIPDSLARELALEQVVREQESRTRGTQTISEAA